MIKFLFSKTMVDVQWAFISIVTASLAHFILRIILGKEFGPDGLGLYTLAFTIYLFGMQFAAFGIGSALTKYVAEFSDDMEQVRTYVSSGMTSSIITGLLMGLILFLLAPFVAISFFHTPELERMIQLTALCFPFIAVQKAVIGTLNGFRRMNFYALLNVLQNATVVIVSIVLVVLFDMGVLGAVIGFVSSTILISSLCPILIRDCIAYDSSLWNYSALQATTVFGFYVVLGNSIGFLNTQIDSLLIGYYLNTTDVGTYAVAVLLAQTLTLIPSAVQRVTAPITTSLYQKGDIKGIRIVIFSTMQKTLIVTLCLAFFIGVSGNYLIMFLFSKDFFSSYVPLIILLFGYFIFAPFMAVGATLSSIGKVHVPFRISTICGIVGIVMNVMLIPYLGIIGAAISTVVILILNFGLSMLMINKSLY